MKTITMEDPERVYWIREKRFDFLVPMPPETKKLFLCQKERILSAFECAWVACLAHDSSDRHRSRMDRVVRESIAFLAREAPSPQEAREEYYRGYHDLWCFHLAWIVGDTQLLEELSQLATYAIDDKTSYCCEQAWSGVWKFAIQGDWKRAKAQMEIMYRTPKPMNLRLPRMVLLRAWFEKDWKGFNRALRLTYEHLWKNARRYKLITQESETSVEVDLTVPNTAKDAGWQEIAFCLHALRNGGEVTFDPLFFPSNMVEYARCQ